MIQGHYDAVFALLPVAATHGHHQAATRLALESAMKLPENGRPMVFGCWNSPKSGKARPGDQTDQAEEIASAQDFVSKTGYPGFSFDRTRPFGYRRRLNYHVWVNWMIAEHKSQGLFQTYAYRDDLENFVLLGPETASANARTTQFFTRLFTHEGTP